MMSGQQPIDGVGGVKKLTPAEHQDAVSDLKSGELSITQGEDPNDVTLDFRGDGTTKASAVTARFMELNPLNDPVLGDLKGSDAAATYAAEVALRMNPKNRHLLEKGLKGDSVIPNGELFTAKHSDLKRALAPFKGRLNELRSALANLQPLSGGMSSGQGKAIGKANTPAIGLPIDPKI